MRRRGDAPELLDGPLDDALLAGNLRDLERVNRWLGGADLSWRAIRPFLSGAAGAPLRVLDVGTGAADIPRALLDRAARSGAALEVVATDVRPEIVRLARQGPIVAGLRIEEARADAVDAADGEFEIAHCSLVLHHLEPDAARTLLAELARVASRAVVVNDLERGRHWLAAAWLLSHALTGNAYTRHDAPLSVRRAYTPAEVVALASAAGLRPVARHRARPPYRYALVFASGGGRG